MTNTSTTHDTHEQPAATEGMVPRPADYDQLRDHRKEVITLEQERRRSQAFRFYTGWALAGVFGLFALVEGARSLTWGHPQDRFQIAILHDDGTYSAPVDVKNLSRVEKREVLATSLVNYISYREGYTYASSQKAYDIVSAMTTGKEQSRYQKHMLDQNDPENPLVMYGEHGQITALDIRLDPDPNSENSWNFSFTRRVIDRDGAPEDTPMRGTLTFVDGHVPTKYRVPYDPASVVVLQYESHGVTAR
ncbi:VirB8/TrbF family protein [Gluconobacter cerinus]|uniref:VirB8/TrbF family protein n=1 Tax=Gluconobacter cerinus TaxID=38307 RepID=UPI001B8B83FC|nr:VirB8/TrbF family protein [Gluconobacter cerinus]MBS0984270.1 hypothetical protein [Gluconobacter cerinus]